MTTTKAKPIGAQWRGIFLDGPQPDVDDEGEEIPMWVVYVGNDDGDPVPLDDTDAGQEDLEIENADQTENDTRWDGVAFTLDQLKAHYANAWRQLIVILTRIAENYVRRSFTNPGDLQPLTFKDAEDITSKIVANLYERIGSIKTLDHLEASFRTALRHRTIDQKRRMKAMCRGSGQVYSAGDPEVLATKPLTRTERYTDKAVEEEANAVSDAIQTW